ncbi:hypothetical protein ABEB36_013698 [Hypothenemus hampei]
MAKLMVLVSFYLIGIGFGMPTNNEQLDKTPRNSREYIQTSKKAENTFKRHLDTITYEQVDPIATVNDVSVNTVHEEKKPDLVLLQQQQHPQVFQQHQSVIQQQPSTVEISGITTGANPAPANPATPQDNGGFRPQRAGSMFARLIDDIFQIPITVLQNVARLITNPFTRKETNVGTAPVAA